MFRSEKPTNKPRPPKKPKSAKNLFDYELPPSSESREAIVWILISVLLTTDDDERMKLTSVMLPLVSKATWYSTQNVLHWKFTIFTFHLVCKLVLDVIAWNITSGLIDNPLPLIELGQDEVPLVVLHQLPGLLTLGGGGVSPLVPGQSAAHQPAHAVPETRGEAVVSGGVAWGVWNMVRPRQSPW